MGFEDARLGLLREIEGEKRVNRRLYAQGENRDKISDNQAQNCRETLGKISIGRESSKDYS
jgi:hypothetical protein